MSYLCRLTAVLISVYSQAWPSGATTGIVVSGFAGAAIGGTGAIPSLFAKLITAI